MILKHRKMICFYFKYPLIISVIICLISVFISKTTLPDEQYVACEKTCDQTRTMCYVSREKQSPHDKERLQDKYYDERRYWTIYPIHNKTDKYIMKSDCTTELTGSSSCDKSTCYYDGISIPKQDCNCYTVVEEYAIHVFIVCLLIGLLSAAIYLWEFPYKN